MNVKYEKKSSIAFNFIIMLIIYAVIAISISTVLTFVNQKGQYEKSYEENLRKETEYVKTIIENDIEEFKAVQDYFKTNSDKILIPIDLKNEDLPGLYQEYQNTLKTKQPELFGNEAASFDQYNDEVKASFVKYWFSRFLLTIENAKQDFGLDHTYFIYPASDTEMVYMYDLGRKGSKRTEGN